MSLAAEPATSRIDLFKTALYELNAIRSALGIMEWDQQVLMPAGGVEARSEHLGILSELYHHKSTSDEFARLLEDAEKDAATDEDRALCRVARRNYDLATKIPAALVAEKSRLGAIGHEKWVHARANNDFKAFAPTLERMFDIAREEAEHLGYVDHIYDALLDQYEEGAKATDARAMFDALKKPTRELLSAIKEKPETDDSILYGKWDEGKQKAFTEKIAAAIGYDFGRGRQDTAPHPFCTGWSIGDIRITTRYKPYLGSAIFGTLHESGHAMYEQGSPMKWDRLPLAGGVSLGIHESQSRTWENLVGRSKAFWTRFLPDLQQFFPELSGLSVDQFYKVINKIEPSFIRVEADELTYNMHVLTRFELECDLLTRAIQIKDLPEAWNAKYEEYLGIRPKTDSEGCLQDVHWSGGMIGYFPTYSMGNLLSYQFWTVLKQDLGDVDAMMAKGDFAPILGWLTEKIYSKGCYYTPKELVMRVTGKPMGADDYIAGLTAKYRDIYGL